MSNQVGKVSNWVFLQAAALSWCFIRRSFSLFPPLIQFLPAPCGIFRQFSLSYLMSFVHICSPRGPEVMKMPSFCVQVEDGNKWWMAEPRCQTDVCFQLSTVRRMIMLPVSFSLLPHSPEYFPGTLSRAWLSSLCTDNICPAARVLDMTRKFTSNEPTEGGNFTLQ